MFRDKQVLDSTTTEQMKEDLISAGWKKKLPTVWSSPTGKLFLGPYGAWKVMKACSAPS